jgi:hypothetical protein
VAARYVFAEDGDERAFAVTDAMKVQNFIGGNQTCHLSFPSEVVGNLAGNVLWLWPLRILLLILVD